MTESAFPSGMMEPPMPGPEIQRDVQRWLGRCMLRLQQYERLIKAVVAHHALSGSAQDLLAQQDARVQEAARTTLGPLIESFVKNVITQDGVEANACSAAPETDAISFAFRVNIAMTAEDIARTSEGLKELLALRNTLVHHFLERFDLWQVDGCIQAQACLQDCYERIDGHYEQLRAWAAHMEAARQQAAAFLQTAEFQNLLINGIAPDGTVEWGAAGCISVLRAAEKAGAHQGWAPLPDAAAWIAQHYPEQTPEKYGCRRWAQVLNESRQFDLQYRTQEGRRVAWFRSRA